MRSIVRQKSKNSLKWQKFMSVCASTPHLCKYTSFDRVFLMHKFKMMTSPDVFFIFSKFWFSGLLGERGVTGQKMAQNNKKFCLTPYLRNCTSYECFLLHISKMVSPAIFFIFSKVWFFRFFRVHQWITKGNSEVCPPSSHVCDFIL